MSRVDTAKYEKHIANIQGKKYMTVEGRVQMAQDDHALNNGRLDILTEVLPDNIVKATVISTLYGTATGHAQNHPKSGGRTAQDTNPIEDAETSAVGRALGLLGYGTLGSGIASANEVQGAKEWQGQRPAANRQSAPNPETPPPAAPPPVDEEKALLIEDAKQAVVEHGWDDKTVGKMLKDRFGRPDHKISKWVDMTHDELRAFVANPVG